MLKSNQDELLKQLIKQDSAAITSLYKDHYLKIRNMVNKNNGHDEDAEDLFQETIVTLLHNVSKPGFQLTATIGTYLYSIAYKKWLYLLRQKKSINKSKLTMPIPQEIEEEEWNDLATEQEKKLSNAFAKIGEDCQKVITAFYYDNKSLKEIAQIMDYSLDFIKVKKHRCMKKLKNLA